MGIRRALPCVGFGARFAVVRRAFPRRDDEDLNLRAPRDGPGECRQDLNGRVAAGGPGELLPVAGGADAASLPEGREAARAAGVGLDPLHGVHAVKLDVQM